jgi:hypothetical protein
MLDLCASHIPLWSKLIAKVCHKGIYSTSKGQKELSIIEPKTISDAYGLWTYDVLCGQLKIVLRMVDQEKPLPPFFSVDSATKITWAPELLESISMVLYPSLIFSSNFTQRRKSTSLKTVCLLVCITLQIAIARATAMLPFG